MVAAVLALLSCRGGACASLTPTGRARQNRHARARTPRPRRRRDRRDSDALAPYADIDCTDLDAPTKRAYDDEIRLVVDRVPSGAPSVESLAWISFTAPGQPRT